MASSGNGPTISRGGSGLPSRAIVYGVEGVGKTSLGAYAPKPIFCMTKGETGLLTLIDSGLVGETDHFDEVTTWPQLLDLIRWLINSDVGNRTFVLDALDGAEKLCFDHVRRTRFGDSPEAFLAFGRGVEVSLQEWSKLFDLLGVLHATKRMAIMLMCHARVKTFKNPEGDDYDRYYVRLEEKYMMPHALAWPDMILFLNFESFAKKDKGAARAKGVGGSRRIIYTDHNAAFDAKNRYGLPQEIAVEDGPDGCWRSFSAAMKQARQQAASAKQSVESVPVVSE